MFQPSIGHYCRKVLVLWGLGAAICALGPYRHGLAQTTVSRGVNPDAQPLSGAGQNGTYYALVIGINQYRAPLNNLQTAANDAEAVARVLHDEYSFRVTLLRNEQASRVNILNSLSEYRRNTTNNDSVLIYYAGHGVYDRDADKAYWLPADADKDSTSNWISADDLTTAIRVLPARHVLIISDSCYSGGLMRDIDLDVRPADRSRYLAKMLASKSRTLMASGGNEPVADSGSAGHSVFANAILSALARIGSDEFAAGDLFNNFVRQQVAGRSEQVPQYSFIRNSNHESGDFVFVRKTASVSAGNKAIPLPAEPAPTRGAGPTSNSGTHVTASWEKLDKAPGLTTLIAQGSFLFGGAQTGAYRSANQGQTWDPVLHEGLGEVTSLAACGNSLFATVHVAGGWAIDALYTSDTSGETWRRTKFSPANVSGMACASGTVVVGATRNSIPVVEESKDGGATWTVLRTHFTVTSIATSSEGVSILGKENGSTVNEYCYDVERWTCSSVTSNEPSGPGRILLTRNNTTYIGTVLGSVMVSQDGGKTWNQTGLPINKSAKKDWQEYFFPEETVSAMTIANGRVVIGTRAKGLYIETGEGTFLPLGDRVFSDLTSLAYDGTFLYATSKEGVFRLKY